MNSMPHQLMLDSSSQTISFSEIIGEASSNIAKDNQELSEQTQQQSAELETKSSSVGRHTRSV